MSEASKQKPFGHQWPVTFNNPNVHSIIYVIERCVKKGEFQEIPCCQLIIARIRDFIYMLENGGYGYFQVDYKSGKWKKLSRSQFDELLKDYRKYRNLWVQSKEYIVSKEYAEYSPTAYPIHSCTEYHHSTFCEFLKAYYPDCKDATGAVFVFGNKEGLPLVQIRMKRENDKEYWSAYYPRDNKCVTLSDFSWEHLKEFSQSGGTVIQVQPRALYGKFDGYNLERNTTPYTTLCQCPCNGHKSYITRGYTPPTRTSAQWYAREDAHKRDIRLLEELFD